LNPKAKGSGYEREVAKKLSEWVNGGPTKETIFWRSPGSGGVFTIKNTDNDVAGDIVAMKSEGKFLTDAFVIECKSGYCDATFDKWLKGNKTDPLYAFMYQPMRTAESVGKGGMLVFRKKGVHAVVGFDLSSWRLMAGAWKDRYIAIGDPTYRMVFVPFKEWLSKFSAHEIKMRLLQKNA
jgi:hypothetical protein